MPGFLVAPNVQTDIVQVYSNNAARDAAIPLPYIGMIIFISSTAELQFWGGSSWTILNQIPPEEIPVYANAAARDIAKPTPAEGDACYLADTNTLQVYNGVAWVAVSSSSEPVINPLSVAGI
jgi:hypothetical protein